MFKKVSLIICVALLAACAPSASNTPLTPMPTVAGAGMGDSVKMIEKYLQAKIAGNEQTIRALLCAAMEKEFAAGSHDFPRHERRQTRRDGLHGRSARTRSRARARSSPTTARRKTNFHWAPTPSCRKTASGNIAARQSSQRHCEERVERDEAIPGSHNEIASPLRGSQ